MRLVYHCGVAGLIFAACVPWAWAAEDPLTDGDVEVRREGAHRLRLPKDWPVEQEDGVIAPATLEEYLSLKFGQIKEKFGSTDRRLEALEQRLETLENDQNHLRQRLERLERAAEQKEGRDGDQAKGN